MKTKEESNLTLEQKILSAATGVFAGLGTLWLVNDIGDFVGGSQNPYETIKETVFNIAIPSLAYLTSAASLYLTKIFGYEKKKD